MHDLTTFGLLCFTSFFTLLNPLGTMPIYLSMTNDLSEKERTYTARKAVLVAFFALLFFAFAGQLIFRFFGISVDSLRVVGGIIFFLMGFDMLQARLVRTQIDPNYKKEYIADISVTPLAIPMICGPGAITNAIVLMEDANTLEKKITMIAAIAVNCVITFIGLYSAARFVKFLGETGNKILMRLVGLIVMVIAVEFFFAGLKPLVQQLFK